MPRAFAIVWRLSDLLRAANRFDQIASAHSLQRMTLAEIKTAIEQLSFKERAELAAWLHGWKDDDWTSR